MRHVTSKVSSDDAVPCCTILSVKLLLQEGSNVLFDRELFKGPDSTLNSLLLHLLGHVCIFNRWAWIDHSAITTIEKYTGNETTRVGTPNRTHVEKPALAELLNIHTLSNKSLSFSYWRQLCVFFFRSPNTKSQRGRMWQRISPSSPMSRRRYLSECKSRRDRTICLPTLVYMVRLIEVRA